MRFGLGLWFSLSRVSSDKPAGIRAIRAQLAVLHFARIHKSERFNYLRRPVRVSVRHVIFTKRDTWRKKLTSAPGSRVFPFSYEAFVYGWRLRDRAKGS